MHAHTTTKAGTRVCADLMRGDEEGEIRVVLNAGDDNRRLVVEFRQVETFAAMKDCYMIRGESPTPHPVDGLKGVLTMTEVQELIHFAAEQVEDILSYIRPSVYLEPDENYRKAVKLLRMVLEKEDTLKELPAVLHDGLRMEARDMWLKLLNPPNTIQANEMGAAVLERMPPVLLQKVSDVLN